MDQEEQRAREMTMPSHGSHVKAYYFPKTRHLLGTFGDTSLEPSNRIDNSDSRKKLAEVVNA